MTMDNDAKAIALAGLITGYTLTVLQLTPGIGNRLSAARTRWRLWWQRLADAHSEQRLADAHSEHCEGSECTRSADLESMGTLADCGWCAAPYVGLPVWLLVSRVMGVRSGVARGVLGWVASSAAGAFLRDFPGRI